jgi:hypothetical protein
MALLLRNNNRTYPFIIIKQKIYHNYKESVLNHLLLLCLYEKISPLAKLSLVSLMTIMILLLVAAPAILSFSSLLMTIPSAAGTSPSSGIELSPQPVYQREPSTSGVAPINQTHIRSTFSANGTLTLPNTTETINTTSNGTAVTSLTTQSAKERRPL